MGYMLSYWQRSAVQHNSRSSSSQLWLWLLQSKMFHYIEGKNLRRHVQPIRYRAMWMKMKNWRLYGRKILSIGCPYMFLVLMWNCMKNLIEFRILCVYLTAVTVLYPNYLSEYMASEQDWFRSVITYRCTIMGRCCHLTLCMKWASCTASYSDVNKIYCSGICLRKDS